MSTTDLNAMAVFAPSSRERKVFRYDAVCVACSCSNISPLGWLFPELAKPGQGQKARLHCCSLSDMMRAGYDRHNVLHCVNMADQ